MDRVDAAYQAGQSLSHDAGHTDRAQALEERLAVPVILAALASVPATFLTMLEGVASSAGTALHWVSLSVLTAEAAVLLVLSGDRLRWLREHWFVVGVTAVAIPAVIFAVGPVQLLRLLRFVGALRILRARRIIKAGRVLQRRMALQGRARNAVAAGVTMSAGAFAALVLSDPTSYTRRAIADGTQRIGFVGLMLAGLLVGVATFVVRRYGRGRARAD